MKVNRVIEATPLALAYLDGPVTCQPHYPVSLVTNYGIGIAVSDFVLDLINEAVVHLSSEILKPILEVIGVDQLGGQCLRPRCHPHTSQFGIWGTSAWEGGQMRVLGQVNDLDG